MLSYEQGSKWYSCIRVVHIYKKITMIPLMKERRDREGGANLFVSGTPERLVIKVLGSSFTMKTWTVPLSLETANHLPLAENEMLHTTALSEPLLTCIPMSQLSSTP